MPVFTAFPLGMIQREFRFAGLGLAKFPGVSFSTLLTIAILLSALSLGGFFGSMYFVGRNPFQKRWVNLTFGLLVCLISGLMILGPILSAEFSLSLIWGVLGFVWVQQSQIFILSYEN